MSWTLKSQFIMEKLLEKNYLKIPNIYELSPKIKYPQDPSFMRQSLYLQLYYTVTVSHLCESAVLSSGCVHLWLDDLSLTSHVWGSFLLCVRRCTFRWLLYGLSLICFPLWTDRAHLWMNVLSQISHAYGFSPVCMRRCTIRAPLVINFL